MLDAAAGEGVLPDHQHLAGRALPGARRARCSAAAGPRATTGSRGRSRRARASAASTSSSTARSRGSSADPGGAVTGVETSRGPIRAHKVALVAAGPHERARLDGRAAAARCSPTRCRRSSRALYEPVLACVVMSEAVHVYVSQADKGELVMGAGIDPYNGYGQRGSFHVIEHQLAAAVELFPIFRHASLLRTWGGIVDVNPDASPIIDATPIAGPVPELRLGNRRVQGDARQRLGLRRDARDRRAPRAREALRARPVHDRRLDRRARRRGGRALMRADSRDARAEGHRPEAGARAARGHRAGDLGDRRPSACGRRSSRCSRDERALASG